MFLVLIVSISLAAVQSLNINPYASGTTCTTPASDIVVTTTKDGVTNQTTKQCLTAAYQIIDCLVYYDSAVTASGKTAADCAVCKDPTATVLTGAPLITGKANTIRACVPKAQQVKSCPVYVYDSTKDTFTCTCAASGVVVPISSTNDAGAAVAQPLGCVAAKVPGCLVYQYYATGTAVGCKTCQNGYGAAGVYTGSAFTTVSKGYACPKDGTAALASCPVITVANEVYSCTCTSLAGTTAVVYSPGSPPGSSIEIGCMLISGSNYDANCQTYTYSATATAVACNACKASNPVLTTVYTDPNLNYQRCLTQTLVDGLPNCKIIADLSMALSSSSLICVTCNDGYELLATATNAGKTINQVSAPNNGYCVLTGRFDTINYKCTVYTWSAALADIADSTGVYHIPCTACATGAGATGTATPCAATALNGGICTGAGNVDKVFYSIDNQAQSSVSAANNCWSTSTGIIDFCTTVSSTSTPAGATVCTACKTGYNLVESTRVSGTKTLCIADKYYDKYCLIYKHSDLTCTKCSNGLSYDKTLKRCRVPTDVSSNCVTGFAIGSFQICSACNPGYTLKDGKCCASVQRCKTFQNCVCTKCVDGYQLVGGPKCLKLPDNCKTINDAGVCTGCNSGYQLNSSNLCAPSASANTACSDGFYPGPSGYCIAGNIENCAIYTVDGKCSSCKPSYSTSADLKQCIKNSDNNDNKDNGLKPCPDDTTDFIYKRNPAKPDQCVKIDKKCDNYNEQTGKCGTCKDWRYYPDTKNSGNCIQVIFP